MRYLYIILISAITIFVSDSLAYSQMIEGLNEDLRNSKSIKNLDVKVLNSDVNITWDAPKPDIAGVLLEEGFDGDLYGDWKLIDADGDQNNWAVIQVKPDAHSGVGFLISLSYVNENLLNKDFVVKDSPGPLYPNNYIITPKLSLPDGGTLTYYIASQDSREEYFDHYGVFISYTNNEAADFGIYPIYEEVATKNWSKRYFDLPAGTNYVAIRHYNSANKFAIKLDDIKITSNQPEPTYSVYRGDEKIANNLKERTFTDTNVEIGEHIYCVEANYFTGNSSGKECSTVQVVETNIEEENDYRILIRGGLACIEFDIQTATELTIYDAAGSIVNKTIKQGISSDFYTPGLYVVHYNIGNVQKAVKLVVR